MSAKDVNNSNCEWRKGYEKGWYSTQCNNYTDVTSVSLKHLSNKDKDSLCCPFCKKPINFIDVTDSSKETLKHISNVQNNINYIVSELHQRGGIHDRSKLEEPEKSIFDEFTPKLKDSTYGSDEYKQFLKEMQVALDHHYHVNSHHPEHVDEYICKDCGFSRNYYDFKNQNSDSCQDCGSENLKRIKNFSNMNLIDIIEMLCDWEAATKRHKDGCIYKSIEHNQQRFGYSDEIKQILINTIHFLYRLKILREKK